MSLLQIVQSMFSSVNVNMSIQVMASAAFSSYVLTNHQNDALDIRAPSQGDLGLTFYPLRQLTKFQTGGSSNDAVVNDPTFNAFYTQALAATSTAQVTNNRDRCQSLRCSTAFRHLFITTLSICSLSAHAWRFQQISIARYQELPARCCFSNTAPGLSAQTERPIKCDVFY